MGLLSLGTPLHWNDSKKYAEHVRSNGIIQFLNTYKISEYRDNDKFYWGDEIEYMMVLIDEESESLKLSIDHDFVLNNLSEDGIKYQSALDNEVLFHPEYGRFMLEATPLNPYDGTLLKDYLKVENNMHTRRILAIKEINSNKVYPLTLTAFPLMGVDDFCSPSTPAKGSASKSLFLPDEIINKHARFPTLTANIRRRRGQKVAINIPLFKDINTRSMDAADPSIPVRELFPYSDSEPHLKSINPAAKPGHIYMDSMGFGMGSSCLQVTMQAKNITEARYLFDSLVNIAPLMLAITAASPIFRGHLADQDVRWNVISGAVDDRTPFERNEVPLDNHPLYGGHTDVKVQEKMLKIPKSRYDSIDQYLGDGNYYKSSYNDLNPPINEEIFKNLLNSGIDEDLARHFAHLFIRDPIVIFSERVDQDNTESMDHFENIQSTNWQTLRFKVPSQDSTPNSNKPGWRIELRPMEISLTDFENAAYSVFSVLLSRAIIHFKPNNYINMSLVEENMKRAHHRDAINKDKFYIRVNTEHSGDAVVEELSLNDIFNGSTNFRGLIPLVKEYVELEFAKTASKEELDKLNTYFDLISGRASGKVVTTATYFRNLIDKHPDYKHDSIVPESVAYNLCIISKKLTEYDPETVVQFFGEQIGSWLNTQEYSKIFTK
ncbi:hypothetical protein C6P40_001446 [Pichia californica]|uniref:Glutamate--cysteine ligase n=1 Tax=Pichia californica TaxID=460514 RepID=A0A9P6WJ34_9ASCO|nr:hypothetical protein C6P42_001564 [[Candida] californica]KAG0688071.1 hypothetical protein C6P40_001446 [[Candida] californica]